MIRGADRGYRDKCRILHAKMSLPSHGLSCRAMLSSQPLARGVPDSLVQSLSTSFAPELRSLLGAVESAESADVDVMFAVTMGMVVHANKPLK